MLDLSSSSIFYPDFGNYVTIVSRELTGVLTAAVNQNLAYTVAHA